jgi:hypothetical protein
MNQEPSQQQALAGAGQESAHGNASQHRRS